LGSSVVLGMIIGAVTAGNAMHGGRRRALIIDAIIGLVGCLMTQYFDFWIINLGRVLFGISSG